MKLDAFEAVFTYGGIEGAYSGYEPDGIALAAFITRERQLKGTTLPRLRAITRATELAFYKHGLRREGKEITGERMPSWIRNAKWERDYVFPGKRTKYNRLILTQDKPGQLGVSLSYRVYQKSAKVA